MNLLTWKKLFNEADLLQSTLKIYTRTMFNKQKGLGACQDDQNLFDFATHTPRNMTKIRRLLRSERFEFSEGVARHFNFNGKERTIYIYPWQDRIVDTYLFDSLSRHFDHLFPTNTYAYRGQGYGVDQCQRDIQKYIKSNRKPLYIIKRDFTNYFPSITHEILLENLKTLIDPNDYLFRLAYDRIKFKYLDQDCHEIATQGVPFGCPIACFFANVYLREMDRFFDKNPKLKYFRYADDILIMTSDRNVALQAVKDFDDFLIKFKLSSKPKHHKNLVLSPTCTDLDFEQVTKFKHLGLEFRLDDSVGLSRDKQRKIQNLFKRALKKCRPGKKRLPLERAEKLIKVANQTMEKSIRDVAVIDYYIKSITDEPQLARLDRWIAEEILSIALQTGHKKGNWNKISYNKLRELGLNSLVHRRRLILHEHIDGSFFKFRNDNIKQRYQTRRYRKNVTSSKNQGFQGWENSRPHLET